MTKTQNGVGVLPPIRVEEDAPAGGASIASPAAVIAARLEELRGELTAGETQMAELDRRRAHLRDTMLRIGGAIQALEEILYTTALRDEVSVER